MKYAEFEKLNRILKEQNSSLNEFMKNVTGKSLPINETEGRYEVEMEKLKNEEKNKQKNVDASTGVNQTRGGKSNDIKLTPLKIEELNFKGEGWNQIGKMFTSPRTALSMRRLVKAAKRLEANIQKKLIDKYYPKILQGQKNILLQVLQLQEKGEEIEKIIDRLQGSLDAAKQASAEMLKQLSSAVQKMVDNSTKRINNHIRDLKIKETNKERLENFWIAASTGIMENFFASIINNQTKFISDNIKDQQIKKLIISTSNIKGVKTAADKKAKETSKAMDAIKGGGEGKGEEKSEETK